MATQQFQTWHSDVITWILLQIKQPKRRSRLCRVGLPIDLISQILALRHSASADGGGETLVVNGDLLDLLMRMRGGDDSADNGDDGELAENPGDCNVS